MKTKIDPQEKRDAIRYKVISTGEKIKAIQVGRSAYKDIATGKVHAAEDLQYLGERRHMVQLGFHIWRFGLYLFAREYLKYNSWFIVPGVSVDAVNGYDRYLDIEIKLLCIGFGIRFIWIKSKKIEK